MNKITIILPIYNVEKYIKHCIKSIINQNCKDFEVILVDDGSMDNSSKIAENMLKTGNIDYKLIKQKNKGVSGARNTGLEFCETKYVVFVDPDDILHKDFLANLLNAIEDNNCDISMSNYKFISSQDDDFGNQKKKAYIYSKNEILENFLKRKISFLLPSMLFKTEILKKN